VGGLGTLIGPILGATTLTLLSESLRALEKFQLVIFGALVLLTVLFLPTGLAGLGRRVLQRSDRAPAPLAERAEPVAVP
jgi:branched-chain amino acid transport system permease protein